MACCSRPPTSGFAPQPRTRRKERPPSCKSAPRDFRGDEETCNKERPLMANDNIFSGLKGVDLASFIAGPGAAVILSDFGAEVITVEPPTGDAWRIGYKIPPQPRSHDNYPCHLNNRNKRRRHIHLRAPQP